MNLRCTGCGSTDTIEEIRAKHPRALSCCPERDVQPDPAEGSRMKPVRAFEVTVEGYGPFLYSARTPAKARYRAYLDYLHVSTRSFREFLAISTIRQVPAPPGAHERILVCGKPATRVIGPGNRFVYDDGDVVMVAHNSEIKRLDANRGQQ